MTEPPFFDLMLDIEICLFNIGISFHTLMFGLASVAHAVIQAIGRMELEDGRRTGVRLKRLHAHCDVCTSPTVMLTSLWGIAWPWGWDRGHNSHAKT